MSRHKINRKSSPSHRDFAKRMLKEMDEKNRRKKIILQGKLEEMGRQKVAVRFTSSFSPDLDAIDAFKKGEDYQGYVGKGKNRKLKYEVKGNKLFLLGHLVAEKTKSGLRLNNAGFDTNLTYATFKELGVPVKRIKGTEDVIIGNQKINAFTGEKVNISSKDISPEPIRAGKPKTETQRRIPNRTVTEQSGFRDRAIEKEMKEQGITGHELPLDTTQIQPKDQEIIRGITGIKEKKVKPKRATHAHHLLPVANFPGLKENLNNSIMLTTPSHHELHKHNRPSSVEQTTKRIQSRRDKPLTGRLKARLAGFEFVDDDVDKVTKDFTSNLPNDLTNRLNRIMKLEKQIPPSKDSEFSRARSKHETDYLATGKPIRPSKRFRSQPIVDFKGNVLSEPTNIVNFDRETREKFAGIKPLIRKKKTGTIKKKIPLKNAMQQEARHLSAEALVDKFARNRVNFEGRSGVYDPVSGKILDAFIPADKMRLQEMFNSGENKIGFNSITDTRKGPNLDLSRLKAELNEIERAGGTPAIGFDEGSLEALDVVVAPDEETIMGKLLDNQRSTGILSPTEEFKIRDNDRFTQ
jgi:hypothetical protein